MLNKRIEISVLLLIFVFTFPAEAQRYQIIKPGERNSIRPTLKRGKGNVIVSVELLALQQRVGLAAQQWAKTFAQLGTSCRVHQPLLNDKPEIKETKRGKLRFVTLIGFLDDKGTIHFPGKTFSQRDTGRLKDWLQEVKSYGAQGAPKGQPVWGLSRKQFDPLHTSLAKKVEKDLFAIPLSQAIKKLDLPAKYRIRITAEAQQKWKTILEKKSLVRQPVKGFSKGTALAIILNDHKLGFRPLRTPSGSIELALVMQADDADTWPIGWKAKTPFPKIVRKLYRYVPIELEKVKLLDLLHAISVKIEIPVLIDYYHIEKNKIKIKKILISFPARKTSWHRLLGIAIIPNKMTRKYKIDEAGKPFVWVTTPLSRRKQKQK
ncbi:hypothetical protein MNBD_PLANCTO02-481 [hydrothermal vent metagenome]|uniref:Uncharacterized protein n=1 Tax=hydrothermal vent metagenome TaxID=652676 RepID=A0A3B1DWD6_9ZZZZ